MPDEEQEELEWKTRRRRVDPKLRRLGWNIVPFAPDLDLSACSRHAVAEFPRNNGSADYALILDGRIVGRVEAKRLSLGPQNVLTQAQRYACGLEADDFNFNVLRHAVSLFYQRRDHLVPRRALSGEPFAPDR